MPTSLVNLTQSIPRVEGVVQTTLFSRTARAIVHGSGARAAEVARLHADGLLTVDPDGSDRLSPEDDAELSFLCALVASGLDGVAIRALTSDLERPYRYDVERMVYDFEHRCWLYAQPASVAELAEDAIEAARRDGAPDALGDLARDAISALVERATEVEDADSEEDDELDAPPAIDPENADLRAFLIEAAASWNERHPDGQPVNADRLEADLLEFLAFMNADADEA